MKKKEGILHRPGRSISHGICVHRRPLRIDLPRPVAWPESEMNRPMPTVPHDPSANGPALSVLIPVYNEAANVALLHAELTEVLGHMAMPYELIFVDDGSTDGTTGKLSEIQNEDPGHVSVAFLRRNCGQTAAL